MYNQNRELCKLNIELYSCISKDIDTDRVILTDKQLLHIAEKHPEAYNDVLIELNNTIQNPDYIINDEKNDNTGLVIRALPNTEPQKHSFIVLRICTDSQDGLMANSVISGWKISEKRLRSYLRNKTVLYRYE